MEKICFSHILYLTFDEIQFLMCISVFCGLVKSLKYLTNKI